MDNKELLVARVVLWGITGVVCLPFSVWTAYQLRVHWNSQWLVKRRRAVIVVIYVLISVNTLIVFPLYGFVYGTGFGKSADPRRTLFGVCLVCSWSLLSLVYCLRVWILHYDHQYGKVLASCKWKILLDPSVEQTDWYLRNRRKYGSNGWITKWVIMPLLCGICVGFFSIYLFAINDDLARLQMTVSYFGIMIMLGTIFVLVMWRKYPKINDVFKIRLELKMQLLLLATVLTPWFLGSSILFYATRSPYIGAINIYMAQLLPSVLLYFLIIYPPKAMMNASTSKNAKNKTIQKSLTYWSQIAENEDGYEAFANFLESEFSVENILFVTEYIQFKHVLMDNEQFCEQIQELELDFDLNVPESIPLSQIASEFNGNDEDMDQSFYACAHRLYTKYIDPSQAMMEVNISSSTRHQLMFAFRSQSQLCMQQILPLMERAAKEISGLMNDSYSRFRQKTVFYELNDELKSVVSMSSD